MARKPESDCSSVIDSCGLHELATLSANLRAILIAQLQNGTIGVPSWVWREFNNLYLDEAAELADHITKRIQFGQQVHVRAAQITEQLNLGFSRGAYDNHVELYTAALALNKNYAVLTSSDNILTYEGMNCVVKQLIDLVNEDD